MEIPPQGCPTQCLCSHFWLKDGSKIVSILAMPILATQIVRRLFELDICPSQELKLKKQVVVLELQSLCWCGRQAKWQSGED